MGGRAGQDCTGHRMGAGGIPRVLPKFKVLGDTDQVLPKSVMLTNTVLLRRLDSIPSIDRRATDAASARLVG